MEVMSRAGDLQLPCLPLPAGHFLTGDHLTNGSGSVYGLNLVLLGHVTSVCSVPTGPPFPISLPVKMGMTRMLSRDCMRR